MTGDPLDEIGKVIRATMRLSFDKLRRSEQLCSVIACEGAYINVVDERQSRPKAATNRNAFETQVGHGNLLYSARYSGNVWRLLLVIHH